jgi:hypothetical protein
VLKSRRLTKALHEKKSIRSARGAGIIAMSLLCGMVIMPTLAIFSFEMSRMFLAKQQLQNASDAAVLAATAQLASSNNTNPTTAHTNAIAAALTIFQQNDILGVQLATSSTVPAASDLTPVPGEALLFFTFIDPVTKLVVPISSPNGKIINLQSAYCANFAFGNYLGLLASYSKYIGINNFTVDAIAKGAVPILDVEVCFDVSGSMDDETNVTFVRRAWDASLTSPITHTAGEIVYPLPSAPTPSGLAQGTIFNILLPAPTGISLNGNFPQLFDQSSQGSATFPLTFTGDVGNPLRAYPDTWPDAGKPPGNYPPGPADNGQGDYTDVVVNLDGNVHFGGITIGAYSFPDINTLVEASRGNLENSSVFNSSKANTSVSVTPKPGYQAAYFAAIVPLLQPIANSQAATLLFANILNTDTDCHFALVAFDQAIGVPPGSTGDVVQVAGNSYENVWNLDQFEPYGAMVNYPLPLIPLNPALAQTNYSSFGTAIQSTVALGGTDIGAAISQAVTDLQTNGRPGSVKAIILFTDGEPTYPTDAAGQANARAAAVQASNAGYPVYTIGLAQIPAIEPSEIAILNDTNSNPTTGGIAAISGHGATFDLVTDSSQLSVTFEKIARRLVELVSSNSGDY